MTYYRHNTPFFLFFGIALFVVLVIVGFAAYSTIIWPIFFLFLIIAIILTLIQDEIWLDSAKKQIVFLQGFRFLTKPRGRSLDQIVQLRTERVESASKYSVTVKYQLFADFDPSVIFGHLLTESQDYKSLVAEAKNLSEMAGCPLVEGKSLQEIRDELGPEL